MSKRINLILFLFTLTFFMMEVYGDAMQSEDNINLYGMDMYHFSMNPSDSCDVCSEICLKDPNCKSYTYSIAGTVQNTPICWLKYGIPAPRTDYGCISGYRISNSESRSDSVSGNNNIPPLATRSPSPTNALAPQSKPASAVPPELGNISLDSAPQGASVFLDGELKGNTPEIISDITPGDHTLLITNPGYQNSSMTLKVISGETLAFTIPLQIISVKEVAPASVESADVIGSGGDLIVKDLNVLYNENSHEIAYLAKIKNVGTTPIGKIDVIYFLTTNKDAKPFTDGIDTTEALVERLDINSLEAGEERASKEMKKYYLSLGTLTQGIYWFGVYVHSIDETADINVTNNVRYWDKEIVVN